MSFSLRRMLGVLAVVLLSVASFGLGLYSDRVLFAQSNATSLPPNAESVSVVKEGNFAIPPATSSGYSSITFGNVSTVGYQSVTLYVFVRTASGSGGACGGIYFNGYWKPDKSFPQAGGNIPQISFSGNVPFASSSTGDVVGGIVLVAAVQTYGNTCSLGGLWLTVYLR